MLIVLPFLVNSILSFAIGLLVAKMLGPAEYGRFALALSVAVVLQTFVFEWLRLAALRFYSDAERASRPEIRATLDVGFGVLALAAAAVAAFVFLGPVQAPPSPALAALAIGAAAANGAFDLAAALVRARFLDRAYGLLVVAKNVLALVLAVGGAWWFQSASVALAGLVVSAAGSIALVFGTLRDPQATPSRAQGAMARQFAFYAVPIVLANLLYQVVPMMNRGLAAETLGYAESGQLALAFEIGIRIVGAIGSGLDVILFQLAVLTERIEGAQSARAQLRRNMGVVVGIVLPAAFGAYAVLPAFEALLVPESFRGPFAHYFALMTPALAAFGIINYAIYPAFQIERRTLPLVIAALAALLAYLAALALLPATSDATNYALAQSISSVAGLVALVVALYALTPVRPRLRDVAAAVAGVAAMVTILLPMRTLGLGLDTLVTQIVAGFLIYFIVVMSVDIAELRTLLLARLLRK